MATKPAKRGNRVVVVKAHDAELKSEVEQFFADHGTRIVKNESELVRRGVRYFIRDFRRSGGYMDPEGFPIAPSRAPPSKSAKSSSK